MLQRVHESGTGLHAGVRQVMQWNREGKLSGIRGTLAELFQVDRQYDTALEVALGGHLQDIVVERWLIDAQPASRIPLNLYRPRGVAGRVPAIVMTCGHGGSKSVAALTYVARTRNGFRPQSASPNQF